MSLLLQPEPNVPTTPNMISEQITTLIAEIEERNCGMDDWVTDAYDFCLERLKEIQKSLTSS